MSNTPCFCVHAIESPSELDLRLGKSESKSLRELLNLQDIPNQFFTAYDRDELRASLYYCTALSWHYKLPPMVHLSCHGCKEGIGLTDGTLIDWAELAELLRPIHKSAYGGGISVTMSSCWGSHAAKMAETFNPDDIPYSFLIGADAELSLKGTPLVFGILYYSLSRDSFDRGTLAAMAKIAGVKEFEILDGQRIQEKFKSEIWQLIEQILKPKQAYQMPSRPPLLSDPLFSSLLQEGAFQPNQGHAFPQS